MVLFSPHVEVWFNVLVPMHGSLWLQAIELGAQIQRCHQLVDAHPALSLTPQEQIALVHKRKQLLRDKT